MKSATFRIEMSGPSNALTNQALHSQASGEKRSALHSQASGEKSDTSETNRDYNVHIRRYTVDSSFHGKEIKNSTGDSDSNVLAALKSTGISPADSKVLATLKSTGISFPHTTKE